MRRSWVLADGERKRLTSLKSLKKETFYGFEPMTRLQLDKDELDQIQDCLDKNTLIRNQTEDMNPMVNLFLGCVPKLLPKCRRNIDKTSLKCHPNVKLTIQC